MNALVAPQILRRGDDDHRGDVPVPATSDDTARWVWHGRYGAIVIEVIGDSVYVDGDRVEPY
jgi:hypothetical protein